ncbi:uncharacterized protein LOC131848374 [Achroia grisella]|uniref:uncharacterized protein LOC131848374 n=1 Tax=Achroia grisella TaxID=688607 RepID=UPI0027D2AD23|nr:uncharacterized protein LOC131848374 [Achroia grisella]
MIIALQTLIFFRESLLTAIDRLLRPYYKYFLLFNHNGNVIEDDDSEDHVFAEFDDEKGVVFYPPVYAQRYAAVSDCLMDDRWCGKLEKVVDLGYHDMSFIKYLKDMPGIKCILGVDIESIPLRCSSDMFAADEYSPKREHPLQVTLFQGNAADPDYRLIGCDAVVAIEMIEHMLPHDLERLVHTVFGFIKPRIAVFTTPNSDFNTLFKALEKNGLRRLDHFFEWSREQFHDWCSNIVSRYPQYTVSCKGIGPGPTGTLHYGCCSQLALFISKDYHKQQDLNLNSLALVANAPDCDNVRELIGSWELPESPKCHSENKMLCLPNNVDSFNEFVFSDKQSCVTVLISPSFSLETLEYRDKMSQCNLDFEVGKNFLMFDDELCFDVLVPRRILNNRVYEIEDITSRLNCTTLQVKKFSKTTQNMMARNRVDTLVHTREVVDEIRHLTKMLNFNKEFLNKEQGDGTWYNFNWGDNAPYWNQYYTIVREYNYPFENKSEECRILDLISDEVNRFIDMQYDEEFSVDVNKLDIPIDQLMKVVQHITQDVDRVKDLLEWNGYEVVGDVVIHSRLMVDSSSVITRDADWQDNDTISDWDTTDIHSTSLSDGSTTAPEYHGRCLRRALDHKVRRLRSMLTADEDIAGELDRVVCRLMKLALRTSYGRQAPPPSRWMQCKLFDLLTLTEKAIERRKKHFIDSYPLKAIDYDYQENKIEKILNLTKHKDDNSTRALMDKYRPLVDSNGIKEIREKSIVHNYLNLGMIDDDFSITSKDVKELDFIDDSIHSPSLVDTSPLVNDVIYCDKLFTKPNKEESRKQRIQAWVDDDVEIFPYPNYDPVAVISFVGDTDPSVSNLIPESFVKYCHPENKENDISEVQYLTASERSFSDSIYENVNVSATEESLLINIVTDDIEETIALRRTIGTNAEDELDILKPCTVLCSMASILKNDNGFCYKSEVNTENIHSQTIFLYDINEPSTSKGVRHISMDVQCGPDIITPVCPMSSTTTSVTRVPKIFTTGIKIGDSFTNIRTQNSIDFGTSTNDYNEHYTIIYPTTRSNGIEKIIDSDLIINEKVDCATMITDSIMNQNVFCTETKLIKPISSSLYEEESVSEFYNSKVAECFSKNTSEIRLKSTVSKEVVHDKYCTRCIRPKLRCGGVHVHSYRDKQVYEDVIYQGEWQQHRPKVLASKRTIYDTGTGKKVSETMKKAKINSKEKIHGPIKIKFEHKKNILMPVFEMNKVTKELSDTKMPTSNNIIKYNKNIFKVCLASFFTNLTTSKILFEKYSIYVLCNFSDRIGPSKNFKQVLTYKRNMSTTAKKESKNLAKYRKKNNIPMDLKNNPITQNKYMNGLKNLNQNIDSVNTVLKVNKEKPVGQVAPLVRLKTKDINKELLKFTDIPRNNMNYIVFRNEIDKNADCESSFSTNKNIKTKETENKRPYSPQSQNSSTYSSPNSVATVRVASNRSNIYSSRRYSLSNEMTLESSQPDINNVSIIRNKKYTKKCKIAKKTDDKGNDKENIPESSTKYKLISKKNKNTTNFIVRNKSIYRAQFKTDNKTLQNNIMSKQVDQTAIVSKVIMPLHTDDIEYSSVSKNISLMQTESTKGEQIIADTIVATISNQIHCPNTQVDIPSVDSAETNCNIVEDPQALNRHDNCDDIFYDMRLLVEECLNLEKRYFVGCDDSVDSESLFLSSEDIYNASINEDSSPTSYRTVITNEDLNNSLQSDLDNTMNQTFDSILGEDSILTVPGSGLTITDLDLNSFKSITCSRKISENVLAAGQNNNTQIPTESSVRDLFERKNLLLIQNPAGALALQAFSGYSVNIEPIVGDRPDRVNFIDSETGSVALDVARQVTSEEVFISGRSSTSYESCLTDDDAVLPYWLFHIISQQSVWLVQEELEEPHSELPLAMPEPMLDPNGNTLGGVGVAVGAGDGHGMHSDRSQDSSGRGTSLSSTGTSSGVQSEVILIDPSAFTAQFELLRDSMDNNASVPTISITNADMPDASFVIIEGGVHHTGPISLDGRRNPVVSQLAASDVDADISSLDTDAPDSSDN